MPSLSRHRAILFPQICENQKLAIEKGNQLANEIIDSANMLMVVGTPAMRKIANCCLKRCVHP
jgi:hypothetical protein